MIIYVSGFYFSEKAFERKMVFLKKLHGPAHLIGKWTTPGGKAESLESLAAAIQREFKEEAGVDVKDWEQFALFTGTDYMWHCFRAFGNPMMATTQTDEPIWVERVDRFLTEQSRNMADNLHYLIPLALDLDVHVAKITRKTK